MADGYHVRPAVPADAADVAACHVASWREAYPHLLSAPFLAALDVDARRRRWQSHLESDHVTEFHVGLVGGDVVGFAVAGPGWDDPPVRDLALGSLYVRESHHGSGLGQALLDAAISERPCSLWVAVGQPRAIAFYTRNGFVPDGARRVEKDWENLEIMRMVR